MVHYYLGPDYFCFVIVFNFSLQYFYILSKARNFKEKNSLKKYNVEFELQNWDYWDETFNRFHFEEKCSFIVI